MDDYRYTLNRAGNILIVVGAIDVIVTVTCVLTEQNYSSMLNVLAIAAGIYLRRGRLKAALWSARLIALMLAGSLLSLLTVLPDIEPLSLWVAELNLHPVLTLLILAVPAIYVPLLVWTYYLLRRAEVRGALEAEKLTAKPPLIWFGIGATLSIFMAAMLHLMFNGESAKKAIDVARAQNGAQYEYVIRQIFITPDGGSARMKAFNDDEIRDVSVTW